MDKFLRAHETIKEEASDDGKDESSSWKPSSECDSDRDKRKSAADLPHSVPKQPRLDDSSEELETDSDLKC